MIQSIQIFASSQSSIEQRYTPSDLDRKIQRISRHLEKLEERILHKKTHGGKRFRARKISLKQEISMGKDRLNHLQSIRDKILSHKEREPSRLIARPILESCDSDGMTFLTLDLLTALLAKTI